MGSDRPRCFCAHVAVDTNGKLPPFLGRLAYQSQHTNRVLLRSALRAVLVFLHVERARARSSFNHYLQPPILGKGVLLALPLCSVVPL